MTIIGTSFLMTLAIFVLAGVAGNYISDKEL